MARQLPELDELLGNYLADDDLILVRDMSAKQDKRLEIGDLLAYVLEEADIENAISDAISSARATEYPVGAVKVFYDNSDHSNYLGYTWQEVTDYDLVAYAYLSGEKTIAHSKNITSVTGSAGSYTVNLSKTMADTNYIPVVNGEVGGTGQEIVGVYGKTTASFKYDFCNHGGSATTPAQVNIAVFGRLATPEYRKWRRTA